MPIDSYIEQLNVFRRIERCRDCELNKIDHCMHEKAVLWRNVDSEASEGIRPWVWGVEKCPKEEV
jgi:hypothetical protein